MLQRDKQRRVSQKQAQHEAVAEGENVNEQKSGIVE